MAETILAGRYRLAEKIGQGGFAAVYKAEDQSLGREVAVKLLDPRIVELEGQAVAEQFKREARAVARLNHPHIVTIFDVGQEGSQLFLVMELLPGGDLAGRLAEHGPYTLAEALTLLGPLAAALDYAHAAGLVHRDVKPQNVLFAEDGRPALTDFGLVKVLSGTLYASGPAYSDGSLLGTPAYMAPEQIDSDYGEISPAVDRLCPGGDRLRDAGRSAAISGRHPDQGQLADCDRRPVPVGGPAAGRFAPGRPRRFALRPGRGPGRPAARRRGAGR